MRMITHGIAIAKNEAEGLYAAGEEGSITAYLPDMEVFAVIFEEGRWFTFKETKEEFHERFEVILFDGLSQDS
jgi:hypothetical protein